MAFREQGPPPFAFTLGRFCEEFQCLPSEALAEIGRMPLGALEEIIEMRSFASCIRALDAADTPEKRRELPSSDLMDLAMTLHYEIDGGLGIRVR